MSNEFQRDYLLRLPLPLAQLYARAHNAKDGRGRHDNCFYLCELTVKLVAAPMIVQYLKEARTSNARVKAIDNLLVQLALPSLGQWVGMLRELARHFGSRPDAASHPLGHLWEQLSVKRHDLPGVLALFQRIKNGPEGKVAGDRSCSILQLIESLVQYRNAVFGHGAGRVDSFYDEQMGPLLFPAVNELLAEGSIDLLGPSGSKLVYLVEVKTVAENRIEVGMRELVSLQGERMAPLFLDAEQASQLLPDRVAVVWPGRTAPLLLDPLLVYRENELSEDVLFLNRDRNGRQVEYLSYCTGRTERVESAAPAMARMLSEVTGQQVTAAGLDKFGEDLRTDSTSVESSTDETGSRILGDFEILTELGRGGMGVVYLARQKSLGRLVALKMLSADMAGDEVALARFRREMRALGRCEHSNIVKVLSSGTFPDGQLYYAMEYVPGADLEQTWRELAGPHKAGSAKTLGGTTWHRAIVSASGKMRQKCLEKTSAGTKETTVAESPTSAEAAVESAAAEPSSVSKLALPPLPELPAQEDDPGGFVHRVVAFIRDAARALQAVHDQGIVHRDIKPANLMLTPDGSRVVLMDFGLAKSDALSLAPTQSSGFLGTLRYSAPEQLAAAQLKVGPQADIRALGITMWELLTRERLFGEAEDERQLTSWVLTRDVPKLRTIDPMLDADLEAIVARATERSEENRLRSAREMADYLDLYLQGKPIPIRTPGLVEIAKRWVRENAAIAASTVAALFAVLITVVIAFVLITGSRNAAIRARNAAVASEAKAREAEQEERAAKEEASQSLKLANQAVFDMLTEVGAESLNDVPQVEGVRKNLLNKALDLYKEIGKTSGATDQDARYQTAKAHFEVAQIHHQIGSGRDVRTADEAYKKAIGQFESLAHDLPTVSIYRQELARCHMWLGELLREFSKQERADEADRHYSAAIEIQGKLVTDAEGDEEYQYLLDLGRSHMNRGINRVNLELLADAQHDYETAKGLFLQALDRQTTLATAEEGQVLLAKCHNNTAILLRQLHANDKAPAAQAYAIAIEGMREVINARRQANQPVRQEYSLDLARFHTNLANHLHDIDQAVLAVERAKALNVGTREVRIELARFLLNKAVILYATERDQAISDWESAASVLESVLQQNAQDTEARELLTHNLYNIFWAFQDQGDDRNAIRTIDRLAEIPCEAGLIDTFIRMVKNMTDRRMAIQDDAADLADEYQQRIRILREKLQRERDNTENES